MPSFEQLREKCLQNGTVYEDPDFPANNSVLYFSDDKPITWARPKSLVELPVFIREATYYDLNQGHVGDCFFLAAVNSLLANDRKMFKKVIPKDQGFAERYAGIFHFNFWQYGEWKEVIVDDRLPIKNGRLAYSRNLKEPDEFWICLLEKAYAKLYGSYKNIDGGYIENALVDLTGGLSEVIEIKENEYQPDHLFKVLYKMWEMDTIISLSIYQSGGGREHERQTGLLEGHAYAMTRLAMISLGGRTERLVRIRNPWGKVEWTGAWSDKSTEWNSFSQDDRNKMGLVVDEEGEFWMRLEDVLSEFDSFNCCHKEECALEDLVTQPDAHKGKWSTHIFKDRWVKNVSSGGSDPEKDVYWRNPQYIIDLDHRNESTYVVISLMEVMPKGREILDICMGFDIYKLKEGVKTPPSYRFDKESMRLRSFIGPSGRRESCKCIAMPRGIYVIIPYNKERATSEFLIRIYCECYATVRPADDLSNPFTDDEKMELADPLETAFEKFCHKADRTVDASELKSVIEDTWRKEFETEYGITLETCRCLMAFVNIDHHGVINFNGVKVVYKCILTWMKMFFLVDANSSFHIEVSELVNLLKALDIVAGRKIAEGAAIRYGGRDGKIGLDEFIQCIARFFTIGKTYKSLNLEKLGVPLTDYISEVLKV